MNREVHAFDEMMKALNRLVGESIGTSSQKTRGSWADVDALAINSNCSSEQSPVFFDRSVMTDSVDLPGEIDGVHRVFFGLDELQKRYQTS